jgi:hypothetical protein
MLRLFVPLIAPLALLLVVFGVVPGAQATPHGQEYYVDQSHPLASDSNAGSQAAPWLTISHAAQVASAGDTVYVKSGFYPERVVPLNTGAPGNPLAFIALPRRNVTMYGFYTVNSDYLHIEGFNITTHESLTGWTEDMGVFIRSDYVEVIDNYFYDLESTAIQGYWHEPFPEHAHVAGNRVYRSQMGIGVTGFDWLVENNEVERLYNYDPDGAGDCDYSRFFGENHVLRGNHFFGTDFDEIGNAHVDCFQTFDNNGEYVRNITIENNRCSEFHQGFMGEAAFHGNSQGLLFQNNIFTHGGAWGMSVHQIRDVTAVHNVFADIRYHGIGFRDGATGTVYNNIFYDAGSNYWAADGGSVTGSHNLLYHTDSAIDPADFPSDLVNLDPLMVDPPNEDYSLLKDSPAIDAGMNVGTHYDIQGISRPQGAGYDIGAYEFAPALYLSGSTGNQSIHLSWSVNQDLPITTTWQIDYSGPPGDQPPPISDIPSTSRTYTMTGLTNYAWYSVTLQAMLVETPILSDTITLMPTDHALLLPWLSR